MSVSYGAYAVVEGENHRKKYEAYKACEAAGVKIPAELVEYFGDDRPHPDGITVGLTAEMEYNEQTHGSEMEVELSSLPAGTTKVVFRMA